MNIQHKIFKPLGVWVGVLGVNIASLSMFSGIFTKAGSCTGSCGACGGGCITALAGLTIGNMSLLAGKKIKNSNWFHRLLERFHSQGNMTKS